MIVHHFYGFLFFLCVEQIRMIKTCVLKANVHRRLQKNHSKLYDVLKPIEYISKLMRLFHSCLLLFHAADSIGDNTRNAKKGQLLAVPRAFQCHIYKYTNILSYHSFRSLSYPSTPNHDVSRALFHSVWTGGNLTKCS